MVGTPTLSERALSYSRYKQYIDFSRPAGRETRKRAVLLAACVAVVLIIAYSRMAKVEERKDEYVLSWANAAAALAANKSAGAVTIPRVLHHGLHEWREPPRSLQPLLDSWREQHPEWEVRVWGENETAALVQDAPPWLRSVYAALPGARPRATLAKLLVLAVFGGVYVEPHTYCVQPLTPLLGGRRVALAAAAAEEGEERVSGALMASEAGQLFWYFVLSKIASYQHSSGALLRWIAHDPAGDTLLLRSMHHFRYLHDGTNVSVLPRDALLTPRTAPSAGGCVLELSAFDADACVEAHPAAFAFQLVPEQTAFSTPHGGPDTTAGAADAERLVAVQDGGGGAHPVRGDDDVRSDVFEVDGNGFDAGGGDTSRVGAEEAGGGAAGPGGGVGAGLPGSVAAPANTSSSS